MAYCVSDVAEELGLSASCAPYEGDGRRMPYEARMMVKVLAYGYVTGVLSSHKLEEDAAFRMLATANFPRHRTPCDEPHVGEA